MAVQQLLETIFTQLEGTFVIVLLIAGLVAVFRSFYWQNVQISRVASRQHCVTLPAPSLTGITGKREKGSSDIYRNVAAENELVMYPEPLERGLSAPMTLAELFDSACEFYPPSKACLGTRPLRHTYREERDGKQWEYYDLGPYEWLSYGEMRAKVLSAARGLRAIGARPGKDGVAIYDDTRKEWTILSQACFQCSLPVTTVYPNLGDEALIHALYEGKVRYLLTNGAKLDILSVHKDKISSFFRCVIYTDEPHSDAHPKLEEAGIRVLSFTELIEMGNDPAHREYLLQPPTPDDVAVVMYTSGTTGTPKGVILTHRNIVASIGGVLSTVSVHPTDTYLSFLPLAHSFALVIEQIALYCGVAIGYGRPRTLFDGSSVRHCRGDFTELRPTIVAGVPVLFDQFRGEVIRRIYSEGTPRWRQAVWAVAVFLKDRLRSLHRLHTPLLDWLVFGRVKAMLGGRCRLIVTGGAPLSESTHKFITVVAGVPVLQGYGLTETAAAICLMDENDCTYGNVGAPIPCCEIMLVDVPKMGYIASDPTAPRGEVWVRGHNVAREGYLNDPDKTAKTFKEGGWFATGDIAEIDPKRGTLKIIDRKKNLVKAAHGEYIAYVLRHKMRRVSALPHVLLRRLEKLEVIYNSSRFINKIYVHADPAQHDLVAIVLPSPALSEPNASTVVLEDLKLIAKKEGLRSFEEVKRVRVLPPSEDWTPENELVTPTQKINRNKIKQRYEREIEEMYNELGAAK